MAARDTNNVRLATARCPQPFVRVFPVLLLLLLLLLLLATVLTPLLLTPVALLVAPAAAVLLAVPAVEWGLAVLLGSAGLAVAPALLATATAVLEAGGKPTVTLPAITPTAVPAALWPEYSSSCFTPSADCRSREQPYRTEEGSDRDEEAVLSVREAQVLPLVLETQASSGEGVLDAAAPPSR